jgi:uncharacterized membrane protein
MTTRKRLNSVLAVFLGLVLVGAVVAVVLMVVSPAPPEPYTEFYLLGTGGKAAGYPSEFAAGEEQSVTVGIISHERESATFRVEARAGEYLLGSVGPVYLAPLEKFERPLAFTLDSAGSRQEVAFLLYKEGEAGVYRSLDLWVDVSPPGQAP